MTRHTPSLIVLLFFSCSLNAQWLDFSDGSNDWLPNGIDNGHEKDIAVGDLDQNGFTDIVVCHKNPFSNPGAREDLLLLNNGTSLVDATSAFAPGFISNPSDSRDVLIADLDMDGWLDVVMCNTFEDQPIFYRNLGTNSSGTWLGLTDESNQRFPLPLNIDPLQFCAIWAGDLTGNGAPDLYFSNYGSGLVEDLLLINDGNGNFTDETAARMGNLRNSAFGTSCEIHDMDGDGDNDIVKISTLNNAPPWNGVGVFTLFNNGDGTFTNWQEVPNNAPYMFTVGDLDGNGLNDVYVVSDNQDTYQYAQGAIPDNSVNYSQHVSTNPRTTGFGGNCKLGDLDNDGDLDLGIANVDVDIPPCQISGLRQFTLNRNNGNGTFSAPYGSSNLPWTVSTYDFAFLDLDGDCDLDLFLGKCSEFAVFINENNPNISVSISGNGNICEGENTDLNAGGNFPTYAWSTGENTSTINVQTGGTYCVTVTNSMGCTGEDCFEVNVFPNPEVNILGEEIVCENSENILAADGNFDEYIWSTGETGPTISIDTSGTYSVTVTDANGCTASDVFQAGYMPLPTPAIVGDLEFCSGANTILSTNQTYTFTSWSTGDFSTSITVLEPGDYCVTVSEGDEGECPASTCAVVSENPLPTVEIIGLTEICPNTIQTIEATPGHSSYFWENGETAAFRTVGSPGEYCVTVTDDEGCTGEACIEIIELPPPPVTIMGLDVICAGESQFLDAGAGFFEYIWSHGAATQITEVGTPGTYCVTVTDAEGCSGEDCFTFDNFPAPQVEINGNENICAGEPQFLDAGAGFSEYIWNSGEATQIIETIAPGTYCVTVTDGEGCTGEDCFTYENFPATQVEISGNLGLCVGASQPLEASPGFQNYMWENGSTEPVRMVSAAGEYCVTATDGNGCTSSTCLTVNELENPEPEIIGEAFFCFGSSEVLAVDGEFETYLWSTGEEGSEIEVSESGNYCVTVTDASGCTGSDCLEVAELPEIIFPHVSVLFCSGVTVPLSAPPGFVSYLWSTGETTETIEIEEGGEYCVTVTDAVGCTGSGCFDAIESAPINLSVTPPQSICENQTAILEATGDASIFQWSNGAIGPTIEVGPGTYCVTATNDDGCEEMDCTEVSLLATPTTIFTEMACAGEVIEIGGQTYTVPFEIQFILVNSMGCDSIIIYSYEAFPEMEIDSLTSTPIIGTNPGTASIYISGGTPPYEYIWENGDTTQTITVEEPGIYQVTVFDANGCPIQGEVEVELFNAIISKNNGGKLFTVSPNPFRHTFQVSFFEKNISEKRLDIYNANGKLMESNIFNSPDYYFGKKLPGGIYFLKIMENKTGELIGWEKVVKI